MSVGIAATAVLGRFGLIGGVIAGAAGAVTFCGLLAIMIRIREMLEECLREFRRGSSAEEGREEEGDHEMGQARAGTGKAVRRSRKSQGNGSGRNCKKSGPKRIGWLRRYPISLKM